MNYELAKELKDAGFPQENSEKYYCMSYEDVGDGQDFVLHDNVSKKDRDSGQVNSGGGDYAIPTLSELIEACGNEFLSLTQISKVLFKENWRCEWLSNDDECVEEDIYGKTPEEAVAKLWLELNKK